MAAFGAPQLLDAQCGGLEGGGHHQAAGAPLALEKKERGTRLGLGLGLGMGTQLGLGMGMGMGMGMGWWGSHSLSGSLPRVGAGGAECGGLWR